jgi:transcriptional regulator with XRE-family HTH domain
MAMESYENNPDASKHKRQVYGKSAQQWREMRGISQEAMARSLGLRDAKAVSRLEKGESPWSLELLEGFAREVEAGSVANLLTQPDRVHIAHANQANPYGNIISYHEASAKEREQLLERIRHLEEEVLHLRKSEEFLHEQLKKALGS